MVLEGHGIQTTINELNKEEMGSSSEGGNPFEQRRVRHITSILLRNVTVPNIPAPKIGPTATHVHRPRPRRSVSTASTSSAGTIRRVPSNKSLRNKTRGRASSIASTHNTIGSIEASTFLTSDLSALRHAISSRLCQTFVTLNRIKDGSEAYRSYTSGRTGVNFEWGKTPGSVYDPDGMPFVSLDGDVSTEESIRITVWYRLTDYSDKGKTRDLESVYVEPGTESALGWSILWHQDVHLRRMSRISEDPATSTSQYNPNTLLLGLSFPLSQVQPITEDDKDGSERAKANTSQERKKMGIGSGKGGDQVVYYNACIEERSRTVKEETVTGLTEADQRAVIRAKLKGGELVRGYEVEHILRLLQLQRELYTTILDTSTYELQSEEILENKQGPIAKELVCAETEERLNVLRHERDDLQENVKMKRKLVIERTEGINRRKARLEIARRSMAKEKASYDDLQAKLSLLNRQCASVRAKAYARRVTLLQQLEFIYPVELVDGASLLFSIVGIPLGNRVVEEEGRKRLEREDDDVVSSALGLIGQVVGLISIYLDTPIHYPIATAGSRSVIQDSISVMSGPRAFPLYSKGVESYRFEYGIFLLNKNIEQLMNHFGITILDIRNTLPNLKNLLVTLSASSQSSSRLSRRNMVGNEMISLKVDRQQIIPSTPQAAMDPPSSTLNSSSEEKKAKGSSGWGMSLLGWGSVKEASVEVVSSAAGASSSSSPSPSLVPTTRTLGSTR